MADLVVQGQLERRDAGSPCFVRVPGALLAGWRVSGPVEVHALLQGRDVGRRVLKRYDSGTYMIELANLHLRWAGLVVGDAATLTLRRAEPAPPVDGPTAEAPTKPSKKGAGRKGGKSKGGDPRD